MSLAIDRASSAIRDNMVASKLVVIGHPSSLGRSKEYKFQWPIRHGKTRSASPQGRPQGAPSHKAIHASQNQMPMPASAHMPPRHAHRPSHCGYAAVLFRASLRSRREAIEAAIHGLEPELRLPATNRRPNPVFTRNEITRLALPPRGCLAAATDQEDDAGAAAGRSRGAGEA
jgi:hypothetical protein